MKPKTKSSWTCPCGMWHFEIGNRCFKCGWVRLENRMVSDEELNRIGVYPKTTSNPPKREKVLARGVIEILGKNNWYNTDFKINMSYLNTKIKAGTYTVKVVEVK